MASTPPCKALARPMVAISTEMTDCPASGRRMARSTSAAQPATAASVAGSATQMGKPHITLAV